MKYGLVFPCVDARVLAELAHDSETAGWDGVFVWDTMYSVDAWVSLAAAAMLTERARLGTMLTPLSRRRPWQLASEVATLDRLSNGRAVLPVGLGATGEGHVHNWFEQAGEETDRKVRAKLLDESLDILNGLWSGKPFSYDGEHYQLKNISFSPVPVQTPRVPIWVVGAWPRMKSMRRVLRCDGLLPMKMNPDGSFSDVTPADIHDMKAFIDQERTLTTPFDIVMEGETPGAHPDQAAALVRPFAEAGATWWLESVWKTPESEGGVEGMRKRVQQGPPRIV